jgi:hypothetical protein
MQRNEVRNVRHFSYGNVKWCRCRFCTAFSTGGGILPKSENHENQGKKVLAHIIIISSIFVHSDAKPFLEARNPNTTIEDLQRGNCQANDMTNNDTHEGSDLANLYTEVLQICQPFYELPPDPSTPQFQLSPRLEDGLSIKRSFGQANPQDPMSV